MQEMIFSDKKALPQTMRTRHHQGSVLTREDIVINIPKAKREIKFKNGTYQFGMPSIPQHQLKLAFYHFCVSKTAQCDGWQLSVINQGFMHKAYKDENKLNNKALY